ncbi:MAG TPA: hypothetical protein VMM12_17240 [Longimicrobiales bacterium]|nr:hypothetical protein [Longimicrobiales bacterium]
MKPDRLILAVLAVLLILAGCGSDGERDARGAAQVAAEPLELSRTLFWYAQFAPAAFLVGGPEPVLSDPASHLRGRAFLVEENGCGRAIGLRGPAPEDLLGRYHHPLTPVADVDVGEGTEHHWLDRTIAIAEGDCPREGTVPAPEEVPGVDGVLIPKIFGMVRDTLREHWGMDLELLGAGSVVWRFPSGGRQLWAELYIRVDARPNRRFALIGAELIAPDSVRLIAVEPVGVRERIEPIAALDVDDDGRAEVLVHRSRENRQGWSTMGVMVFRGDAQGRWRPWKEVALLESEAG